MATPTNLKLKRDRWSYRSGDAGEVIEVEVYYDKGGANYFTSEANTGDFDNPGLYDVALRISPEVQHG